MISLGLKEIFQRFRKRYDATEDGFLYEEVSGGIRIAGFQRNAPYAELPSYIADKPVTALSGLSYYPAEVPLIPDTVQEIESGTFSSNSHIVRVVIPDTVRKIGDSVFEFSAVEEVVFPLKTVFSEGAMMFANAEQLRTVVLSDTMTKIPEYMFEHSGIETIQIPDSVISIEKYAFWQCHSLREIQLPDTLETIEESAFFECHSLEQIVLPPHVQKIESGAFADCENLREVIVMGDMPDIAADAFQGSPLVQIIESR